MSKKKRPSAPRHWVVVDEGGGWHEARGCRLRSVTLSELVEARLSGRVPGDADQEVPLLEALLRKDLG